MIPGLTAETQPSREKHCRWAIYTRRAIIFNGYKDPFCEIINLNVTFIDVTTNLYGTRIVFHLKQVQ